MSGLDYYTSRYYDPVAGVFLSADSMEGNPAGLNPYGYVGGNPETWSDPSGGMYACYQCESGGGGSSGYTGGGGTGSGGFSGAYGGGSWNGGSTSCGCKITQGNIFNEVGAGIFVGEGDDPAADQETMQVELAILQSEITDETQLEQEGLTPEQIAEEEDIFTTMQVEGGQIAQLKLHEWQAEEEKALEADTTPTTTTTDTSTTDTNPPPSPETNSNPARMNPNDIRFTQKEISNRGVIKDAGGNVIGTYTVEGNIEALQNGALTVDDFAPIKVFIKTPEMNEWGPMTGPGSLSRYSGDPINLENGQVYSLDNRRLYTFQQAGVSEIPVEWAREEEIYSRRWHFDTPNWGISILLRS